MNQLGKTFSEARIARGLTLEDCERDTRISKRYLDALEREDWKIFPAPVYSRAFLRTYAQYLGLDPAEMMRIFLAQDAAPEPVVYKPLPELATHATSGQASWLLAAGVVVVLLIAGAFMYSRRGGDNGGDDTLASNGTATPAEASGGGPPPAGRPVGPVTRGQVPDLVSVSVEDALNALNEAGLSYVVVETSDAEGQPGVVLSQTPAPGTRAGGSTSVTLLVPQG